MAAVDKDILEKALKLLGLKQANVNTSLNLDKVRKKAFAKWHPDKVARMKRLSELEKKRKMLEYEENCKKIPNAIKIIQRYLKYGVHESKSNTKKRPKNQKLEQG